jgi:hypothetical protein
MSINKQKQQNVINKEEIIASLTRSGYLLESRIVKMLNKKGFFVEPNQTIKDPISGKSREIDIIAEYYNYVPERKKICVKTYFIMEVINNLFPVVLITERTFSPNMPYEDYIKYIVTPNPDETEKHFLEEIDIHTEKGLDDLVVYSQYSSFIKKRSNKELMAFHPDEFHDSFLKIIEYIKQESTFWGNYNGSKGFLRLFFYQPVLVIQNGLMVLIQSDKNDYDLKNISCAKLEFNYFDGNKPSSILIDIVTEKGLHDLLFKEISIDNKIEEKIYKWKKTN